MPIIHKGSAVTQLHLNYTAMKNILIFSLAIIGVSVLVYTGTDLLSSHHKLGLFFIFVGGCTSIGLTIDIVAHVKERLRKSSIRKLG